MLVREPDKRILWLPEPVHTAFLSRVGVAQMYMQHCTNKHKLQTKEKAPNPTTHTYAPTGQL